LNVLNCLNDTGERFKSIRPFNRFKLFLNA